MSFIRGVNHVTLAVTDLERAVRFYIDGLGLLLRRQWETGAYLQAGELWLCLSFDPEARATPHQDYTHMAFDVGHENFEAAVKQAEAAGARSWKKNKSEGKSFYFLDPDGHKLELHVGDLESRLAAMDATESVC